MLYEQLEEMKHLTLNMTQNHSLLSFIRLVTPLR